MPIYEWDCDEHGRYEMLMPLSAADLLMLPCPICGKPCQRLYSLVSMRPDDCWHFGQVIKGKEIQSRSKILRAKKDSHTITLSGQRDVDDMKRAAESARREKDQQLEAASRRHLESALSNTGVLDSFGEVRREALKDEGNGDIKGTFSANELANK